MMDELKLIDIISRILEVDSDSVDKTMERDKFSRWDSLAHIQIIAELEAELNINIPLQDIWKINTIEDFIKYLK